MAAVWGIHAGGQRSPFLASNVLELDRPGVGDLRVLGADRRAIKRKLAASYPNEKPGTIAAWAGVLLRFAYGPAIGDLVVHPERATQSVSIGRIAGEYRFSEPGLHQREVAWLVRRCPRAQFSESARKDISTRVAFFAIRDSAEEFVDRTAGR
jgi:predicted Mrr-cat superfamily restriction endonuclease